VITLKDQRTLTLGATQAVLDFWTAQAKAATDPDLAQFCHERQTGAQHSVDQLTALLAATSASDPAAPPLPPPPA